MRMGCPKCEIAMEIKNHSIGVKAMTSDGEYAYFYGDLWHCPECGIEVVAVLDNLPVKPILSIWLNQRERDAYREERSKQ